MSQQQGDITGDRDRVLTAIREAMRRPTSDHVRHGAAVSDRATFTRGMPPVADDWETRLATFAARCEGLRATLIVTDDVAAMHLAARELIELEQPTAVACHHHPLVSPLAETLGLPRVCVDGAFDRTALERCELGISGCYALVAQTGSVMITSAATGGRSLTVLPPHHVVLATADQLLPDLLSAYAKFANEPGGQKASMLSLISGPSRTGDIERILVLGAHGPKKLTIILSRQ